MATTAEVQKLAALARITVSEEGLEKFTKEFDAILAYVGQLEQLSIPKEILGAKPVLKNVFRADTNPTPAGTWTEVLAAAFPAREGDALVVKQIISHD